MWCKKCNIIMNISGTSYHPKENKNDKGYRRYDECPSCHYRKYYNGLNFQEVMNREIQKSRSK